MTISLKDLMDPTYDPNPTLRALKKHFVHPRVDDKLVTDDAHFYRRELLVNPPEGVTTFEIVEKAKEVASRELCIPNIAAEHRYGFVCFTDAADIAGPDQTQQAVYFFKVGASITGHRFEAQANATVFTAPEAEEPKERRDAEKQIREMIESHLEQHGLPFRPDEWEISLVTKKPLMKADELKVWPDQRDGVYRQASYYREAYGDAYPIGLDDFTLVHTDEDIRYERTVDSVADGLRLDPTLLPYMPGTRVCRSDDSARWTSGEVINQRGDIRPEFPDSEPGDPSRIDVT